MTKQALFDTAGFPLAFYDTNMHAAIPADAVAITDQQWREFIDHPGARRWAGAAVVPYAWPPASVAAAASVRIAGINTECNQRLAAVTAAYPSSEIASWDKQELEARAYMADPAASVPLITTLAQSRGLTVADLAARILAKADQYAVKAGAIIGRRQARVDQVQTILTDHAAQVAAIEAGTGTPEEKVAAILAADDTARAAIAAVVW